ncbi:MAG: VIT domain-containing protein [Planctomycetota bacterium]
MAFCSATVEALPAQFRPHGPLPAQLGGQHQWIVPSRAVLTPRGYATPPVRVTAARAKITIRDRAATTTLEFELHNPVASRAQEAVLLLPVPDGAAVSQFAFDGAASEPTAKILPRDEARRLYDQITARLQDPALLEFAGYGCLRSSVFPVPANGRQKIRLTYDHVLKSDGARVDYLLPRSEMLAQGVPWQIEVDVTARTTLGLAYSPSHELNQQRRGQKRMSLAVTKRSQGDPGAFRFCFTTAANAAEPTAALFTYPDPTIGGGYFLLLAHSPKIERAEALRREVTIVLDRSGSMAGRKLAQAKAAALQVLEGLADGEGIQVIHYGNDVGKAFAQPVAKSAESMAKARAFVSGIRPHGGTNIHDALLESLRPKAMAGTLPLVLFLTDGLPTVGPTSERDLFALIEKGNAAKRRVYCFGVGNDVNVPLLDRIADATRAVTTYVQPEEDVEVKVARTFARLDHPVLASPELRTVDADGELAARTAEVLPRRLADLFAGDQLVVLGQYRGEDNLRFELSGRTPSGPKAYRFELPVTSATTAHAFVPRLWASRQIAFLVDELRQQGGDHGARWSSQRRDPFADPRLRELRDEILRLSTRYGVLGEYTSFLATEGSQLDNWSALQIACQQNLSGRAVTTRVGASAVNQAQNLWFQKGQTFANPRNCYVNDELKVVEGGAVQQLCDRAFFRRGNRWFDSASVLAQKLGHDEVIAFGSPAFEALKTSLRSQGRGALLSLPGEILLAVDGKNLLVQPASQQRPVPAAAPQQNTPTKHGQSAKKNPKEIR